MRKAVLSVVYCLLACQFSTSANAANVNRIDNLQGASIGSGTGAGTPSSWRTGKVISISEDEEGTLFIIGTNDTGCTIDAELAAQNKLTLSNIIFIAANPKSHIDCTYSRNGQEVISFGAK